MESSEELVKRARCGDAQAFALLYKEVYEDLYKTAYYTLRSSQDAEDVVSETVLDAYRNISKLRDSNAFRTWIFKILSYKCTHKIKEYAKACQPLDERMSEETSVVRTSDSVLECLSQLTPEERLIVTMSVFGGYKGEEISKILHKKHSTIRSKYRRALMKLRQSLELEL